MNIEQAYPPMRDLEDLQLLLMKTLPIESLLRILTEPLRRSSSACSIDSKNWNLILSRKEYQCEIRTVVGLVLPLDFLLGQVDGINRG